MHASKELEHLSEMALVRPFLIGKEKYYKITAYGIKEVEKKSESWYEAKIGASGIGIRYGSKNKS